MANKKYDVIIIGAGPAGIFAAMELVKNPDISVLILEKGKDIHSRKCPARKHNKSCINCYPCSIMYGWGGAGAFSDGKLTLTPHIGGNLLDYIPESKIEKLIAEVDAIYLEFGAPVKLYGTDDKVFRRFANRAKLANLELIASPIRHLGTENCAHILSQMFLYLKDKAEIRLSTKVTKIIAKDKKVAGVKLESGEIINANQVIMSPGRGGAEWLKTVVDDLNLDTHPFPLDIGVRVEVPAEITEAVTREIYEPKLIYYTEALDDRVRTFCVSPRGEVATENSDGIVTINGHSYADKPTDNTNFAILVTTTFTEPFNEPIIYGRHLAHLANLLSGGIIIQRLGDLRMGRRSTPKRIASSIVKPTLKDATPGDLSFVIPYRYMIDILEMLEVLDKFMPGINSPHTLLYGLEVKYYTLKLKLGKNLETEIENLFAIGDGAGVTRGLIQASCSGAIVGKHSLSRY